MKEQPVSIEAAKLTKEKGFAEQVHEYYHPQYGLCLSSDNDNDDNNHYNSSHWAKGYYSAPTQSLLQKWLREEHQIFVKSEPYHQEVINEGYNVAFLYEVITLKRSGNTKLHDANDRFKTYEKALEKGLFEALKLIN